MKRLGIIAAGLLIAGAALAEEIGDLSITDAANVSRWPEAMATAAVNDNARALEGILARWRSDEDCSLVSTGTSVAYSVAATRTLTSYYDGLRLCFEINVSSGVSPTLNADSIGAADVVWADGSRVEIDDLVLGGKIEVVYDGGDFQIVGGGAIPEGPDDVVTTQGDLIRGDSSGDAERLALGNPDQVLTVTGGQAAWSNLASASTSVSGMQENADQADMESEASTRTVTPDQVVQSPYASKAWVRFGVASNAITGFSGQNVDAVAYNATGNFTLDWITDFSGVDYACVMTGERNASDPLSSVVRAITPGGITIQTTNSSGVALNGDAVQVVCFGDQ